MDHSVTVSCQGTPDNLRMLRDWASAWGLRLQSEHLEQDRLSITYLRACLKFELISTWDVGYHLLDGLLAHQTSTGEMAEVRLRFSPFEGDDALLTSAEVQADVPCTCHGEQVSVDPALLDRQCAWEAETLSFLPHVSSQVGVANPEPWASWLPNRCEVRGEGKGVIWYGSVNCNYLVFLSFIVK